MEYLFAVLVPAIAVAVVIIVARSVAAHDFKCRHCGNIFKIKWTRVLITEHADKEYRLTCPHCAKRDFCTEQPIQKENPKE